MAAMDFFVHNRRRLGQLRLPAGFPDTVRASDTFHQFWPVRRTDPLHQPLRAGVLLVLRDLLPYLEAVPRDPVQSGHHRAPHQCLRHGHHLPAARLWFSPVDFYHRCCHTDLLARGLEVALAVGP